MKRKLNLLYLLILVILLNACNQPTATVKVASASSTPTHEATALPSTATLTPTISPSPTKTKTLTPTPSLTVPAPTVTPTVTISATVTPLPKITSTSTPQPEIAAAAPTFTPTPTVAENSSPMSLRDDISVKQIATVSPIAVKLALDPLTQELYYLDMQASVYRLDKQTGNSSVVYSPEQIGNYLTFGLAFGPNGTLYVVGNQNEGKFNRGVIRQGILNSSGERLWSTLATTAQYPLSGTPFDHQFNGIVVSSDGQYVYVNSGSRTDHGEIETNGGAFPDAREVPLTSAIFRLPTDAVNLELPNDEAALKAGGYLFADGVRNSFDLAFAPDGSLFGAENGPDAAYSDELNLLQAGQHYGFPWYFGNLPNPQQFPDYDPSHDVMLQKGYTAVDSGTYQRDPTFPPPPLEFTLPVANLGSAGDLYLDETGQVQSASFMGQPLYTFTAHRAPLGLTFDTAQLLAEPFRGDGFILSYGPAVDTLHDRGQDLIQLELTLIGNNYQAKTTQLVTGFQHPVDSVLVRHELYVLGFGGKLWQVTLP